MHCYWVSFVDSQEIFRELTAECIRNLTSGKNTPCPMFCYLVNKFYDDLNITTFSEFK